VAEKSEVTKSDASTASGTLKKTKVGNVTLEVTNRQLRPRLSDRDRRFWILASRCFPGWQDILVVVSAATVLRWYHRGWRAYWRWRSRRGPKAGRHPIAQAYGQDIGLSPTHSCRLLMVIAQEPTQPLATLHVPRAMAHDNPRKQQDVASALMISLGMVVLNIFAQRSPQGALAGRRFDLRPCARDWLTPRRYDHSPKRNSLWPCAQ
jgi:hypothetical protein